MMFGKPGTLISREVLKYCNPIINNNVDSFKCAHKVGRYKTFVIMISDRTNSHTAIPKLSQEESKFTKPSPYSPFWSGKSRTFFEELGKKLGLIECDPYSYADKVSKT